VGGARPSPFTLFTITYKVAVHAPAERADTLNLFHLYDLSSQLELTPQLSQLCTLWGGGEGLHPSPSPGWANFSIMMECTPESGNCHSVCTLCAVHRKNLLRTKHALPYTTKCIQGFEDLICRFPPTSPLIP
jgi:hypothetical protein